VLDVEIAEGVILSGAEAEVERVFKFDLPANFRGSRLPEE
jgi:hypothetical protein